MKFALVSLDQIWHDKSANFARIETFVREARTHGCDVVVLPEMTLTGYSMNIDAHAEPEDASPSVARFGGLAREFGITIVFGTCLRAPDGRHASNVLCMATPDGDSRAIYSKMHPFSFAGEADVLKAGDEIRIVRLGDLRCAVTICYDLRFPELYAGMAPSCDAAIVIANWPNRRIAHWRALLVARAIENQMFVIGVNRIGTDGNGLSYEKSSMVVMPDGTLLEPVVSGFEMDIFDVDPTEVGKYRASFPTVRDRRPLIYSQFRGNTFDVA